jgi:hypothetical protein
MEELSPWPSFIDDLRNRVEEGTFQTISEILENAFASYDKSAEKNADAYFDSIPVKTKKVYKVNAN